ncbi:ribosomal protein L4/L1 family-domain-containing protein [Blastocladiella britannica]|nr:ribosomal protein L4/L1 family-domain-containing protein [Blastocladiella britannica]
MLTARDALSAVARRLLALSPAAPAHHLRALATLAPAGPTPDAPLPAETQQGPTTIIKYRQQPVYEPPTVQALIVDFATHQPKFLAKLPHSLYAAPVRRDILHRCVVWQRDALRQGTHSAKGRADVRGTTKKFAPQKGRGAARVGTRRAPQFRGGGVVHGPVPRSHATELQVKVRELGLRSAIASKFSSDLMVLTTRATRGAVPDGKTRSLNAILGAHYPPRSLGGLSLAGDKNGRAYSSVLIVAGLEEAPASLARAAANLPDVTVIPAERINVYDVLRHEYLVVDHAARKWLEWRLVPSIGATSAGRKRLAGMTAPAIVAVAAPAPVSASALESASVSA